jgi:sialic acid synthase SpsE
LVTIIAIFIGYSDTRNESAVVLRLIDFDWMVIERHVMLRRREQTTESVHDKSIHHISQERTKPKTYQ